MVGREQVKVGRNMQWLRIDTYFEGDLHAPKAHFQPMACQHCENAGCEAGMPGWSDGPHSGRPERDGLQPLRGNKVLLQQLPV